jgi:hypothetical protein
MIHQGDSIHECVRGKTAAAANEQNSRKIDNFMAVSGDFFVHLAPTWKPLPAQPQNRTYFVRQGYFGARGPK